MRPDTFTPGPWMVTDNSQFVRSTDGRNRIVAEAIHIPQIVPHAERAANARLIAAAPDLLEALRYAFEHAPKSFYLDGKSTPAEWIERARAALAKAVAG